MTRATILKSTTSASSSLWEQIHARVKTLPADIPFSVRLYNSSTLLIRENDIYGEFPHIYLKICGSAHDGQQPLTFEKSKTYPDDCVLVLSDTGVGTEVVLPPTRSSDHQTGEPEKKWNITAFLEVINPSHKVPYLVMTTHCHFDHTMGLKHICPRHTQSLSSGTTGTNINAIVVASAAGKSFITPISNLQVHGQYEQMGLEAPVYDVSIWAEDGQQVMYPAANINTGFTIFHTPGHTPDSLSWYDADEHVLGIGDTFYERLSPDAEKSGWKEPPMPTIFNVDSDLKDWWDHLDRLLEFVREQNKRLGPKRVVLAAAHVTSDSDAEEIILEAKEFAKRCLKGEVKWKWVHGPNARMLFDEILDEDKQKQHENGADAKVKQINSNHDVEKNGRLAKYGRFSFLIPQRVLEEGRKNLSMHL